MLTKDEELSLFLELRRREKEKEKSNLLVENLVAFDAPPGTKGVVQVVPKHAVPHRKTAAEKFLDSENEKSDYDWLITPPGTPLFPPVEMDTQRATMNQLGTNAHPTALKSRLTNIQEEAPRTNGVSKPKIMAVSAGLNLSSAGNRRSSSSRGPKSDSRSTTPTARPTVPSAKPTRSSTLTGRPTVPSTKPAAAASARSSTPTRTTPRSSTPTARHSFPASKSTSRSSTPTRRSSTPSSVQGGSAPASRSSSVTRSSSATSKNPVPSRGISPTVKSRPRNPDDMSGLSHDAPLIVKTSMPKRPASATRARTGDPSGRSSSTAAASNGKPRQQSCSPARGRTSNGSGPGGKLPVSIKSRTQITSDCDDVNPVLMGTQSVERVVNMRKLAPPKQDDHCSSQSNSAPKSSSRDSKGFGRSLSKKSLDMAIRHMDIGRSITSDLRPHMTNIRSSSMYSVRLDGPMKDRAVTAPESPHATSSDTSSEPNVSNTFFVDGIEAEENGFVIEKGNSSLTGHLSR